MLPVALQCVGWIRPASHEVALDDLVPRVASYKSKGLAEEWIEVPRRKVRMYFEDVVRIWRELDQWR